ncbi:hypothetical protein CCB80_03970 [Armatimonadetes bacterium Uphvl-Ar1]|nr:hypothetical protein CCB80_03970 [Armatimonadetes bacterium Uphvl-Ar1]
MFVATLALSVALQNPIQIWDVPITPEVTFRMERNTAENTNSYGLLLDPKTVQLNVALAGGTVYDESPFNGRTTLSKIIEQTKASGGINADFFQWGDDPGGDPSGAMIHLGKLLSRPTKGGRADAIGWDSNSLLSLLDLDWEASATIGTQIIPIDDINARSDDSEVILHTNDAAHFYATTPQTAIYLQAPEAQLTTNREFRLTIKSIKSTQSKAQIPNGEWVLTMPTARFENLTKPQIGDLVSIKVNIAGLDPNKMTNVIGGGPDLVVNGNPQSFPTTDSFAETKHPRSAIGSTTDGKIWLVVVDGRQPQSVGIKLNDLATKLRDWGCTQAMNLDGGGSSSINFFQTVLNKPSAGSERAIANAVTFNIPANPSQSQKNLTVTSPESTISTKQTLTLSANISPIIWTAQGDAWIDQSGTLHPLKPGKATVTATTRDTSSSIEITITE